MAGSLAVPGANFVLLLPDDRTNTTLNGSSPGDDGIPTTSFSGMLMEDGEVVATDLTALEATPFFMTIDNVSGTFGLYKVNLTLPNRSIAYDLFLRHSADLVTVRHESLDTLFRQENLSMIRGNTRYTYTIAAAPVPSRGVAIGVLDLFTEEIKFDGAPDFSAPNLVSSKTIEMDYTTPGDTNPEIVAPA